MKKVWEFLLLQLRCVYAVHGFIAVYVNSLGGWLNVQSGKAESGSVEKYPGNFWEVNLGNESHISRFSKNRDKVKLYIHKVATAQRKSCFNYTLSSSSSKREGEPFHITYLPSNGVYEKDENNKLG